MIYQLQAIGLEVNGSKCELTILDHSPQEVGHIECCFKSILPDVKTALNSQSTLLGAPLSEQCIPGALSVKQYDIEQMVTRLELFDSH